MVKNKKNLGGRRGSKPTTVIDLEANETKDEVEVEVSSSEEAKVEEKIEKSEPVDETSVEEATQEETVVASPPPQSTKAKASMGSMLLSAVLGGGVALGGANLIGQNNALQSVPVIGGLFSADDSSNAMDSVNSEIAALKEQLANLSSASGNVPAEVTDRLAALEDNIANGAASNTEENSAQITEAINLANSASQKAEQAAQKINELNEKIVESAGGDNVDMEAVKAALSGELSQLAEKVAGLEIAVEGIGSQEALSELTSVKETVTSLGALPEQIDTLSNSVTAIEDQTKQISGTLGTYDERLQSLETSVDEKILPSMTSVEKAAVAAIESQKVARSVSARSLSAVLENGGAFSSELASAEALLGSSETVDALRTLSRDGIQSKAELLSGFGPVADKIISLQSADTSEMGVLDRFLSSAQTLVKVRPAGPVEGDGNAAIVSRVEAALKSGDLSGAMEEWGGLDEAAQGVSANWIQSARDYQKADGLINTLIGELSATSSEQG